MQPLNTYTKKPMQPKKTKKNKAINHLPSIYIKKLFFFFTGTSNCSELNHKAPPRPLLHMVPCSHVRNQTQLCHVQQCHGHLWSPITLVAWRTMQFSLSVTKTPAMTSKLCMYSSFHCILQGQSAVTMNKALCGHPLRVYSFFAVSVHVIIVILQQSC